MTSASTMGLATQYQGCDDGDIIGSSSLFNHQRFVRLCCWSRCYLDLCCDGAVLTLSFTPHLRNTRCARIVYCRACCTICVVPTKHKPFAAISATCRLPLRCTNPSTTLRSFTPSMQPPQKRVLRCYDFYCDCSRNDRPALNLVQAEFANSEQIDDRFFLGPKVVSSL